MRKFLKIAFFTLIFLAIFIIIERPFIKKDQIAGKTKTTQNADPLRKIWKEYQKNRSFSPEKYSKEDFLKLIEEKGLKDKIKYPFLLPDWYKRSLDDLKDNNEDTLAIAKKVFDIFDDTGENALNIQFSDNNMDRSDGNRTPSELLSCSPENRKAKCDELAFLFTASCRYLGLESFIIQVDIDTYDVFTAHACSSVVSEDGRMVLIDPAYRLFDVFHRLYVPLDDIEATALLYQGSFKILNDLGKFEQASNSIDISEKLCSENEYVLTGLILKAFYDDHIDKALDISKKLLVKEGISPFQKFYGYMAAGMSYIYKEDFEKAENYFSESISLLSELKEIAKIEKEEAVEKIITSHLFYAGLLQINQREEASEMLNGLHKYYNIPKEMILDVEGVFEEAGVSIKLK